MHPPLSNGMHGRDALAWQPDLVGGRDRIAAAGAEAGFGPDAALRVRDPLHLLHRRVRFWVDFSRSEPG